VCCVVLMFEMLCNVFIFMTEQSMKSHVGQNIEVVCGDLGNRWWGGVAIH